jgi:hypothetical protein
MSRLRRITVADIVAAHRPAEAPESAITISLAHLEDWSEACIGKYVTTNSPAVPPDHPWSLRAWVADHVRLVRARLNEHGPRLERSKARDAVAGERNRPKRARRLRWAIGVVLALLVYPVLGTLFLWTGLFERSMRSDHLIVHIDQPSWTLWPGHIHVRGATVLVNGETQFKLQAKNLLLHVNLFGLFKKHLRVTHLSGDDVHFFLRVKVQDPRGIEQRLAAYPPLTDLPGQSDLVEKKATRSDQPSSEFTVEVQGLNARVSELWLMEYHYVGPATLRGGFLIGPLRMRVDASVQEFGPGELRFGEAQVIATSFSGRVAATIPELNPMEHADESLLELVTADVFLKGDVQTLAHVSAYMPTTRVEAGAGPIEARFLLSNGRIAAPTYATFSTKKVGVRRSGFAADTDLTFDARFGTADPKAAKGLPSDDQVLPRLSSKSASTYVSLGNNRGNTFKLQFQDHEHSVVLDSNQLGRMTDIDHARIRFPKIYTNDFHHLGALTETPSAFTSQAGVGQASLALDIDHHHVMTGPFQASFREVRLSAADMLIQGQGDASCRIQVDLDHKVSTLKAGSVDVSEIGLKVGDQHMEGWWARVEAPQLTAHGFPPARVEGRIALRAKSAEPLLKILAAKGKIPDFIPALTSLNDVRGAGTFRKTETVTDVVLEPLDNVLFDVAGRYYEKGRDSRYAFVVGGSVLSLGIADDGSGLSVMAFAREGWLNEKLLGLPKPVTQVHSSEP